MRNKEKTSLPRLAMLLISLVLGLVVGLFVIFYLWQIGPASFLSLFKKDLNLNSPEYSNANVIIQDPKKVYVSQDLKIDEANNYLSEAVVGVFAKTKNNTESSSTRYIMDEALFSGVVVSSDGWVLTNVLEKDAFDKNIVNNANSYLVVSKKNKKMYEVEKMVYDSQAGLLFLKMKGASGLPVRNLINVADLSVGQTLLSYNFAGDIMINSIKGFSSGKLIKSSDNFSSYLDLNLNLDNGFKNSFIFDLNGDLMALVDANLKVRPVHDFRSNIFNFLNNKEIVKLKYGLSYIDLNDVYQENLPSSGALITAVSKDLLGNKAGIVEGDVVVKINNYEIVGDLNNVLNNFSTGEKITVSVWRQGEIKELRLELK